MSDELGLENIFSSLSKPETVALPTANSVNEDTLAIIEDRINGLLSQSELTVAQVNALQTLSNIREQYVRTQKDR